MTTYYPTTKYKHGKQTVLSSDYGTWATRDTIKRTRSQCTFWKRNGNYKACELDRIFCRPSVCNDFMEQLKHAR